MEEDLLNGDGSSADFINAYGDNYTYNQSGFDAIDNGLVTQGNGSATVSAPSWTNSLGSIFGGVLDTYGKVAPIVNQFTGKTTAPNAVVAQPSAGVPGKASLTSTTSTWFIGIALAVAGVIAWLLFGRKG